MLKKSIFKKLSIIIAVIIVIQIINIFPKEGTNYEIVNNNASGIIYLLNKDNYVSRLDIVYHSSNNEELLKEIIHLLTVSNDHLYQIRNGFRALIPKNTKLLNYKFDDDTLTINFSKEFLNIDKNNEEKMIESIVYTLTANFLIENIIIKVENNLLTALPNSKKPLSSPLNRSIKINKTFDLNSLDNIKETTIFYLAREGDYIYHIPVTKYTNTDKEKVEIIIDELKSSSTYGLNMINYIHEETELIDYELIDKALLLNFNDKLFADITSDNITEEVTYSINLSIKENYDVEHVMYSINNEIYNNYFLLLG